MTTIIDQGDASCSERKNMEEAAQLWLVRYKVVANLLWWVAPKASKVAKALKVVPQLAWA